MSGWVSSERVTYSSVLLQLEKSPIPFRGKFGTSAGSGFIH